MREFLRKLKHLTSHPLVRGMLANSVIWPTGSLIQQTILAQRSWDTYDYKLCMRFALFGSCYMAPASYYWDRFLHEVWPGTRFRTAFRRAMVQQFTFGVVSWISFFFIMSLMQGRTVSEAAGAAFVNTPNRWKLAACYWPAFEMIKHYYIPRKYRMPYMAICTLVWGVFLANMAHYDASVLAVLRDDTEGTTKSQQSKESKSSEATE